MSKLAALGLLGFWFLSNFFELPSNINGLLSVKNSLDMVRIDFRTCFIDLVEIIFDCIVQSFLLSSKNFSIILLWDKTDGISKFIDRIIDWFLLSFSPFRSPSRNKPARILKMAWVNLAGGWKATWVLILLLLTKDRCLGVENNRSNDRLMGRGRSFWRHGTAAYVTKATSKA